MKKRIIDKIVALILDEEICEHEHDKCVCDLREGGVGLCFIGAWIKGLVTSEQVLIEYGYLTRKEVNKLSKI